MGLVVNKKLANGLEVKDAYIRIDTIIGSKKNVEYSVATYISREHFLGNAVPIDNVEYYSFVPNIKSRSENFLRQAFYDLKKRSPYIEGIDVFEEGQ